MPDTNKQIENKFKALIEGLRKDGYSTDEIVTESIRNAMRLTKPEIQSRFATSQKLVSHIDGQPMESIITIVETGDDHS